MSAEDAQRKWVPAALVAGVTAISFAAIFFRSAAPTHPLAAAAIRLLVASVLLLPFVLRAWRRGAIDCSFLKHGAAAGVFYALHFGTWVWSLELTTVAASVTLVTATPLLLAVWGTLTGVDRPARRLWAALFMAAVGLSIIGGVDLNHSPSALLGDVLAFAGAAAMAGYMLVVRRLGPIDVFAFTGVATAVGGILLAVTGLGAGFDMAPASPMAMLYLVLAALIPQLIGHSALTWSLRHATPTTVGIATLGEPVGAAVLAFLLLSETPPLTTVIGCAITLFAVALAILAARHQRAAANPELN